MSVVVLAWLGLACAAIPALLFLWNVWLFRPPPAAPPQPFHDNVPPRISVLIPARNEERGIEACVRSVLASRGVELEVIVLDDASTDRTAEIVRSIAQTDSRLRLETAPPLPEGWCGKQHACFVLARQARYDILTFLDADVQLTPDALARLWRFLQASGAELVSGFPFQLTVTWLEKLLIPLIHWLLLGFLPMAAMRCFRWPGLGAGCGQWFMTTRIAYEKVGGHSAVKSSLHDGLTLPRAYRRAGMWTDLCDARNLARCRMYRNARDVWYGLAKNAREGMAATGQIGFWTFTLLTGQVIPFALLVDFEVRVIAAATVVMALAMRAAIAWRYSSTWLGVVLHPVAIVLLLAVQWYAIVRAILGQPVGWKGRAHPSSSTRTVDS